MTQQQQKERRSRRVDVDSLSPASWKEFRNRLSPSALSPASQSSRRPLGELSTNSKGREGVKIRPRTAAVCRSSWETSNTSREKESFASWLEQLENLNKPSAKPPVTSQRHPEFSWLERHPDTPQRRLRKADVVHSAPAVRKSHGRCKKFNMSQWSHHVQRSWIYAPF